MAMNPIQFQRGMSLPEFHRSFGSEAQCAEALRAARWPQGFCCPRCGGAEHCRLGRGELYQCNACRRQTSLVAGTLMANTKLALQTWFLAIYLISQAKTGLSALALKRQLGVSYSTAWLMHHKIMRAMAQRDAVHRLGGHGADGRCLPRRRACGRQARTRLREQGAVRGGGVAERPGPAALPQAHAGGGVHARGDQAVGLRSSAPGACVASDGLACFTAVLDAGCEHQHTVVGAPSRATCRSSSGSTPCWATSRRACRAPTTRSSSPSTRRSTWQPSPTASTADSICAGSSRGWSSMWPILIPILGMSFGRLRLVANQVGI